MCSFEFSNRSVIHSRVLQGDRAIRMFFLGDGIIEVRRAADTGAPPSA